MAGLYVELTSGEEDAFSKNWNFKFERKDVFIDHRNGVVFKTKNPVKRNSFIKYKRNLPSTDNAAPISTFTTRPISNLV